MDGALESWDFLCDQKFKMAGWTVHHSWNPLYGWEIQDGLLCLKFFYMLQVLSTWMKIDKVREFVEIIQIMKQEKTL
jgi:hypothetical protein